MSTIAELVTGLRSEKVDDVVKELQNSAHAIWQEVWNLGHANATARGKEDLTAKDKELTAATESKVQAESKLEELRGSQPDVAKVREQYDTEIAELKTKHATAIQEKDDARALAETGRASGDLRSELVRRGVDPDYAEVLASKESVKSRIRYVDGEVQILQDGKEIPISAGEGQTAIGVFSEELAGAVPAKFKNSSGDSGSGTRTPSSSSGGKGNVYDRIRESAKARQEAAGRPSGKTAAEKLGMTSS